VGGPDPSAGGYQLFSKVMGLDKPITVGRMREKEIAHASS
jgi:hypothetical protein